MNNFTKWAEKNYSSSKRILALGIGAIIFLILIPMSLMIISQIDEILNIEPPYFGILNSIVGIIFILIGFPLAIWTIAIQITLASGTPFPMIPTKKLIIVGPFNYCRNPMTLGTLLAYIGLSIIMSSISAAIIVLLFGFVLIAYIKLVEEKELENRFGIEYRNYKAKTPFFIPKIVNKR
jgi:protein-S-isoprenylcysteine O-methyltransferase Ste14